MPARKHSGKTDIRYLVNGPKPQRRPAQGVEFSVSFLRLGQEVWRNGKTHSHAELAADHSRDNSVRLGCSDYPFDSLDRFWRCYWFRVGTGQALRSMQRASRAWLSRCNRYMLTDASILHFMSGGICRSPLWPDLRLLYAGNCCFKTSALQHRIWSRIHPFRPTSESVNPNQRSPQPTIDDAISDVESVIEDLTQSESAEPVFAGFQTELPQDAAQIDHASASAQLAPATPTPPPKRPKGRLLIGSLLMVLFAAAFYIVWDGVFRYQAYGLVEGNRVPVRTSSAGFVQKVFVAEGDLVRTGELLLTIENVEVQHRLERTRDSIRLAEAQLDAHVAKLRRIARQREWDVLDKAAEFFELASELPKRRSEVERLERSLARAQKAQEFDGVSVADFDDIRFALKGEQGLLEKLANAVAALQTRNELMSDEAKLDLAELKPTMVHLENLQNETQRLYEILKASSIVAPITGIVVKQRCVAGKWVETSEELLSIVEEGSVEPVLYLSQHDTRNVDPGTEILIHIDPLGEPVNCRVRRLADEFRVPPPPLVRYYDSGEPLLPIMLESIDGLKLRPGAMVKVPHRFERLLDSFQ